MKNDDFDVMVGDYAYNMVGLDLDTNTRFNPDDVAPLVAGKELKGLRENLSAVQNVVLNSNLPHHKKWELSGPLTQLIQRIDFLRPLGPDGKHGNRHTPTCGCEL